MPTPDPRKQAFAAYTRDLADRMGLRDWLILISEQHPNANAITSILMRYGRKEAEVMLSEAFLGRTPEQQREDLTHELTHLHFAASDGMVEDWLDPERYKGYLRMFEYGVDAISLAIAPHMPLPLSGAPVPAGTPEQPAADSNGRTTLRTEPEPTLKDRTPANG